MSHGLDRNVTFNNIDFYDKNSSNKGLQSSLKIRGYIILDDMYNADKFSESIRNKLKNSQRFSTFQELKEHLSNNIFFKSQKKYNTIHQELESLTEDGNINYVLCKSKDLMKYLKLKITKSPISRVVQSVPTRIPSLPSQEITEELMKVNHSRRELNEKKENKERLERNIEYYNPFKDKESQAKLTKYIKELEQAKTSYELAKTANDVAENEYREKSEINRKKAKEMVQIYEEYIKNLRYEKYKDKLEEDDYLLGTYPLMISDLETMSSMCKNRIGDANTCLHPNEEKYKEPYKKRLLTKKMNDIYESVIKHGLSHCYYSFKGTCHLDIWDDFFNFNLKYEKQNKKDNEECNRWTPKDTTYIYKIIRNYIHPKITYLYTDDIKKEYLQYSDINKIITKCIQEQNITDNPLKKYATIIGIKCAFDIVDINLSNIIKANRILINDKVGGANITNILDKAKKDLIKQSENLKLEIIHYDCSITKETPKYIKSKIKEIQEQNIKYNIEKLKKQFDDKQKILKFNFGKFDEKEIFLKEKELKEKELKQQHGGKLHSKSIVYLDDDDQNIPHIYGRPILNDNILYKNKPKNKPKKKTKKKTVYLDKINYSQFISPHFIYGYPLKYIITGPKNYSSTASSPVLKAQFLKAQPTTSEDKYKLEILNDDNLILLEYDDIKDSSMQQHKQCTNDKANFNKYLSSIV